MRKTSALALTTSLILFNRTESHGSVAGSTEFWPVVAYLAPFCTQFCKVIQDMNRNPNSMIPKTKTRNNGKINANSTIPWPFPLLSVQAMRFFTTIAFPHLINRVKILSAISFNASLSSVSSGATQKFSVELLTMPLSVMSAISFINSW